MKKTKIFVAIGIIAALITALAILPACTPAEPEVIVETVPGETVVVEGCCRYWRCLC